MRRYQSTLEGYTAEPRDTVFAVDYEIVNQNGKVVGKIPASLVEESKEWNEIIAHAPGEKVIDVYTDIVYTKIDNGKWVVGSSTIEFTIKDAEIGEGKRFSILFFEAHPLDVIFT